MAYTLTDLRIATMVAGTSGNSFPYGQLAENSPYSALVIEDGKIKWVGNFDDLPECFVGSEQYSFDGRLVTPALIDCHTHVVFGGNRATEFELRLEGASYEEVAKAGGGIVSTVKATRSASPEELLVAALQRVDALIAEGVTTIEIKSGYGLDQENELKMLRVARDVGNSRPIDVVTTYLGAHALPPDYHNRHDAYIDDVVIPVLHAAHSQGLIDAVDGFCEGIAFSPAQIAKVFDEAKKLGLPVKLHAEQLSNLGGAKLAASYGALSADHLEYLDQSGIDAMANSGTVATLLPGAYYTLRETQLPPVQALRDAGVPIAIATDCNPGSSPLTSLLLAMNMACTLFRMTPEEALAGITRNAALALGFKDRGIISPGMQADLNIWDVENPAELSYRIGANPLHKRIYKGLL